MGKSVIYTAGHSNHSIEVFLELLKTVSVNCLTDVRSMAASAYNTQYHKEPLSDPLKANGIACLHFAEEFGTRHADPDLSDDEGKVHFERVRKSWSFKNGVERLLKKYEKKIPPT